MSTGANCWMLAIRSHRWWLVILLLTSTGFMIAIMLDNPYGLSDTAAGVTPLVRLMPIVAGIAVGMVFGCAAPDMERLGGRRLTALSNMLAVATTAFAILIVVAGMAVGAAIGGHVLAKALVGTFAVSVLSWAGLSVLSAVLLHPDYSWVFPGLCVVVVTLFGYNSIGKPQPWNVVASPVSLTTLSIGIGLFVLGVGAWNFARYRGIRAVP